jgi:hypothetical protein
MVTEDQSYFSIDQESTQAPPEILVELDKKAKLPPKRDQKTKIVIGALGLVLILMVSILMIVTNRKPPLAPIIPTPTPAAPQTPSKTMSELQRLQLIVDQANPESDPFPPPQVDMKINF